MRRALPAVTFAAVGYIAAEAWAYGREPQWLWTTLFAPAMPGWYIVWGTGLGSGAHGAVLANQFLPFALTFVVWWIVLGWWLDAFDKR